LIQVGIKAEYVDKDGQVGVYFGNKGTAALEAFTVQYLVPDEAALKLSASPLSQHLEANKQIVQRINVQCLAPFVDPPTLRIQFLLPDTSPRRIQMKFPVVLTKFMVGRDLSSQDFFQTWRIQKFVLNEVTSVVHLATRLQGALVNIARSIVFGGALQLLHGLDQNPDNFVLAGQFAHRPTSVPDRSTAFSFTETSLSDDTFGVSGSQDRGLSLVRVEVGSGRFSGKVRVAVRSSDRLVAQAICNCIVLQLAEPHEPHTHSGVAR